MLFVYMSGMQGRKFSLCAMTLTLKNLSNEVSCYDELLERSDQILVGLIVLNL